MTLKLNSISDAVIQQNIITDKERLEKFLSADPSSPIHSDPLRYYRRLGDISLGLALGLYQQEGDVGEIKQHFARAGQSLLAAFSLKFLSPLELEKALAIAVCFCHPSVYEEVDKVPETHFSDDISQAYGRFSQYLDVLRSFLADGKLNHEAWQKTEALCLKAKVDHFNTLKSLRALRALDTGDQPLLNESIEAILKDHIGSAKHGHYNKLRIGFICLPGLMFACLGKSSNMTCTIESPYLPLQLLI